MPYVKFLWEFTVERVLQALAAVVSTGVTLYRLYRDFKKKP